MILLENLQLFYMIQQSMMNLLQKFLTVHNLVKIVLTVVMTVVEEKKESKVHKSLAEILGIPKRGQVVEQAKVAVVIDPKIAKVLRPHQIEGVKVLLHFILLT